MICGYRRIVAWGLAVVGFGSGLGQVTAAPLDPNSPVFTSQSQGDIVLASGTYTFNLGTSVPSLQMLNGPVFTTVATGFVYNGINVFDFQSLQIQAGAKISVVQISPSGPIALLSSTSISMAGTIDVSAGSFPNPYISGPGASNAFVGGNAGGGSQSGVQGPGSSFANGGAGGGFGGVGQSTPSITIYSAANGIPSTALGAIGGGNTFVSLTDQLRGGSAGGAGAGYQPTPGYNFGGPAAPGLGGGAIELGAVGLVSISGAIYADGGSGQGGSFQRTSGGGGGSGGGILINGHEVDLSGTISAVGGSGGIGTIGVGIYNSDGGTGGGGIIEVVQSGTPGSYSNTGKILVSNGLFINHAVPEPASLLLLSLAAVGGVAVGHRRSTRV